jgi:hypothetical protein
MTFKHILAGLIGLAVISTSCKKDDDPVIPNEEELITTLNYTLIAQNQADTVVLRFQDLDGEGGNDPIIIGGTLMANTVYNGSIELLNEQENPAEDITEEVETEAEEHQFFFQVTNGLDAVVTYADTDANGNPLGLASVINSNAVSNGKLTVILRHQPDKNAAGVANGDITNAGGETDIEVTFDVDIQ